MRFLQPALAILLITACVGCVSPKARQMERAREYAEMQEMIKKWDLVCTVESNCDCAITYFDKDGTERTATMYGDDCWWIAFNSPTPGHEYEIVAYAKPLYDGDSNLSVKIYSHGYMIRNSSKVGPTATYASAYYTAQ